MGSCATALIVYFSDDARHTTQKHLLTMKEIKNHEDNITELQNVYSCTFVLVHLDEEVARQVQRLRAPDPPNNTIKCDRVWCKWYRACLNFSEAEDVNIAEGENLDITTETAFKISVPARSTINSYQYLAALSCNDMITGQLLYDHHFKHEFGHENNPLLMYVSKFIYDSETNEQPNKKNVGFYGMLGLLHPNKFDKWKNYWQEHCANLIITNK